MKNAAKTTETNPLFVASKQDAREVKLINPKRETLTPEILKTFPGYKRVSDEEAGEKCASIKTFARILLQDLASLENNSCIDNQHVIPSKCKENPVISINKHKTKPKAA